MLSDLLRVESLTPLDSAVLAQLTRWSFVARPNQLPPEGNWTKWLLLAGRGFGKTRCGAEWVCKLAQNNPGIRIACIAPTSADARDVMVEGESGILACSRIEIPLYEPSKRRITWKNGSMATLYSAEEPDRLRGPQHHYIWADEIAAWKYPETWDQALFGLRLGTHPRVCITTTPRPIPVIKDLMTDPHCTIVRGSTYDNRDNLAQPFFDQIITKYEGTRLGRQELHAEILTDVEGALWTHGLIEQHRVHDHPALPRVVIGVDPAVTSGSSSDETGIIVAGIGADGHAYVIDDISIKASPNEWARVVVEAYRTHMADRIIGEVNQGGDLVETLIRTTDNTVSYKAVRASKGKYTRAEPISAIYEQGKVHHVGMHATLEDQMCDWVPGAAKSPDRMDALVYALTELMLNAPTGEADFYVAAR